ncbi:MAG: DUF192 domain-containing protein [bacterium]
MKPSSYAGKTEFTKGGELFFLRKVTGEVICKIEIEISDDENDSATGMMYRNDLDENQGMLFILKEYSVRSFWMKNTVIPLDIIFADSSKKIIKIYKETKPLSEELLSSLKPANNIVEVNGGYCKRSGIMEGDMISFLLN